MSEYNTKQINRIEGCSRLGLSVFKLTLLLISCYYLYGCFFHGYRLPNNGVTLRTKVVMKDIQTAIESYRTEYNQFPVPGAKEEASVLSEGTWLAALLAEDEKLNPKKIRFVDLPPAMDKKRGVYQENGQPILVDYWGNKYHVLMDLDSELRIANPEFVSSKPNQKIEKYLPLSSVIYSAGPDGDPNTWEDNVCSWR